MALSTTAVASGCSVIIDPLHNMVAGTQSYSEPSEAMMPTIRKGASVSGALVGDTYRPKIGDVVAFTPPGSWGGSGGYMIKRVLGIPGSTVACCDAHQRMIVDGEALDEPYLADKSAFQTAFGPVVVPVEHVWVQGDNRAVSLDSRNHHRVNGSGPVPVSRILAVLDVSSSGK
jgi:signal peptidase I